MASSFQTLADVFSDVRYAAGKDSNTLTTSDLTRLANKYYLTMVRQLTDLNEDLYAEISSTSLVASQREYPLPTDNTDGTGATPYGGGLLKIQRVEVSYDGTNWNVASPLSLQEIPTPTVLDADLNNNFSKDNPVFWFKDRSLFIAPVPASTDTGTSVNNSNLYIFWIKRPKELSATSDVPNIPKDFLGTLSEGILIDVYRKYGRLNDMKIAQQNFLTGLASMRSIEQSDNVAQPIIFKAARKNYR